MLLNAGYRRLKISPLRHLQLLLLASVVIVWVLNWVTAAQAQEQIAQNQPFADAQRITDLRFVRSAPEVAANGRQDLALLMLQEAFEGLLDDLFLHDDFYAFERAESINALETVLRRAASEKRYEIPPDAIGFGLRNVLYFQVPSENALYRVEENGKPIRIGTVPGRVLQSYDLLPPVGAVLAVEIEGRLSFQKFDPATGLGKSLVTLPRKNIDADWDISMGADGVALVRERLPEELLRRDPDTRGGAFLLRLDTAQTERLTANDRFVLGTGAGGVSYLATLGEVPSDRSSHLGVEVRGATDSIELGFDYTQCLAANAQDDQAALYEEIIRSVAEFANRIRCDQRGGFIAVSAETNTSRGPVDRLHLVDLQDWAERQLQRTEIVTPYLYTEAVSLFAASDLSTAELVHSSGTLLSLTTSVGETFELRFPVRIETAVALGEGRAAIIMTKRPGGNDAKLLSIVDFRAVDRFGQFELPRSDEPHDPASEIGQKFDLRPPNDPSRQSCVTLAYRPDWHKNPPATETLETTSGRVTLPSAFMRAKSCLKISRSGEYAAIWHADALHVLQAETGSIIAEYPMATPPHDFVFSECCEPALLIAEGNAIVYKGIPRLTTFLDEQGSAVETRYANDDQDAYAVFFAEGPILKVDLSPDDSRLLYTVATSAGVLETRLYSVVTGQTWTSFGSSANFQESYFINDDTVYYWDPRKAFVYELLRLENALALIRAAQSEHCRFEQGKTSSSTCSR